MIVFEDEEYNFLPQVLGLMAVGREFARNEVLMLECDPVGVKEAHQERVGADGLLCDQQVSVLHRGCGNVGHWGLCKGGEEHHEQPSEEWIHVVGSRHLFDSRR